MRSLENNTATNKQHKLEWRLGDSSTRVSALTDLLLIRNVNIAIKNCAQPKVM